MTIQRFLLLVLITLVVGVGSRAAAGPAPSFIKLGETYVVTGMMGKSVLKVVEIDKASGWIKVVEQEYKQEQWLNTALLSIIEEAK